MTVSDGALMRSLDEPLLGGRSWQRGSGDEFAGQRPVKARQQLRLTDIVVAAGALLAYELLHERASGLLNVGMRVLAHVYHASRNLVSHHAVMMDGTGEWHYKCAFEDRLHERLAGPSGSRSDTQGIVERLLGRFGAGRLAHVQGTPVGATEGGGDALLSFEDAP